MGWAFFELGWGGFSSGWCFSAAWRLGAGRRARVVRPWERGCVWKGNRLLLGRDLLRRRWLWGLLRLQCRRVTLVSSCVFVERRDTIWGGWCSCERRRFGASLSALGHGCLLWLHLGEV
ncbi:hypothetical protein VPH35_096459 [Triticum aestivum]|uniref:Uncharacterized protein n=1 Tax=Aegilops tauschii subsp. strangulata TaxID=200361 RepID=A0A453K0V5_AEGTS